MIITEKWSDTGVSVDREPTEAELAQMEADQSAREAEAAKIAQAQKEADVAIAAAIAQAKSLGFTDAMIAVMYPNLGSN